MSLLALNGITIGDLKNASLVGTDATGKAIETTIPVLKTLLNSAEPFVSTETSLADYIANDAQYANTGVNDSVFIPDGDGGHDMYVRTTTAGGDATDFTLVSKGMDLSAIRGAISGTAAKPVTYNAGTGVIGYSVAGLTAKTTLADNDILTLEQADGTTLKITGANLKAAVASAPFAVDVTTVAGAASTVNHALDSLDIFVEVWKGNDQAFGSVAKVDVNNFTITTADAETLRVVVSK